MQSSTKGAKGICTKRQRAETKGKGKVQEHWGEKGKDQEHWEEENGKGQKQRGKAKKEGQKQGYRKRPSAEHIGVVPEMDLEPVGEELLVAVGAGDFVR